MAILRCDEGPDAIASRISALDWTGIARDLDTRGVATTGALLSPEECRGLAGLYAAEGPFRSRIVMARHGFGSGEYKYFSYPLPELVAGMRCGFYRGLSAVATGWFARMGRGEAFPETHEEFLARCEAAGQVRPTPLLLQYEVGDYNCLHQDLYGATVFPIQVVVLLSTPGTDFTGGEFVVVEQRPRMQSRAEVVALGQGEAVIFAVNERPVAGTRGDYRVKMRHGVRASALGTGIPLA